MDRNLQINLWYAVAAALALILIQNWWIERQQIETIPYSEFKSWVDSGKVAEVRVTTKK